jgi:hypothetical protein
MSESEESRAGIVYRDYLDSRRSPRPPPPATPLGGQGVLVLRSSVVYPFGGQVL